MCECCKEYHWDYVSSAIAYPITLNYLIHIRMDQDRVSARLRPAIRFTISFNSYQRSFVVAISGSALLIRVTNERRVFDLFVTADCYRLMILCKKDTRGFILPVHANAWENGVNNVIMSDQMAVAISKQARARQVTDKYSEGLTSMIIVRNFPTRFSGFLHIRRIRLLYCILRAYVSVRTCASLTNLSQLNYSRCSAINYAQAMSDNYQDVFRCFSEFSVVQISHVRILFSRQVSISGVRQNTKYHSKTKPTRASYNHLSQLPSSLLCLCANRFSNRDFYQVQRFRIFRQATTRL